MLRPRGLFCLGFCFHFMATPTALGSSQARGWFEPQLRPLSQLWQCQILSPTALGQGLNPHSTATWPAAVGFLTQWAVAGAPSVGVFISFCLFKATPEAYGCSQARGRIGTAATSPHNGHSNSGSEPHLRPTPQLMATPIPNPLSRARDRALLRFATSEPWWELPGYSFYFPLFYTFLPKQCGHHSTGS